MSTQRPPNRFLVQTILISISFMAQDSGAATEGPQARRAQQVSQSSSVPKKIHDGDPRRIRLPVAAPPPIDSPYGTALPSTARSEQSGSPGHALSPEAGCCSDPDVPNYGTKLDFTFRTPGEEITTQYRPQGVLFGRGGSSSVSQTLIQADGARPFCPNQLTLSGLPHFEGWEFFLFVDPVENRWATVDRVGASVGYCDVLQACFIAAYDLNGNLLEVTRNTQLGFQFLSVERPTADISCVLIGDCQIGSNPCLADPSGSAINCLTFPPPVVQPPTLPPPDSLPPPPPPPGPPMADAPGVSLSLLSALVAGLALAGYWRLNHKG